MKKVFYVIILLLLLIPNQVMANENVNIYIFHSYTCIHCRHALEFLDELKQERDDITIFEYEIMKDTNAHNRVLLDKVTQALEKDINVVPFIIIGNNTFTGFDDSFKEKIINTINYFRKNDYRDITGITLGVTDDNGYENLVYNEKDEIYEIETFGKKFSLKNFSLPVIAIVMGLVDGFNPCAMWILLFLISMLFNMKDKKKMWILGLTFIGTSGFVYFLFMMAWLRMSFFINKISTLQLIIALFAIIFGSINLYRYFKERNSSGCTVVKKEKRKLIIDSIKNIVKNKSFIVSIIGIIILAVCVNLIELLCSLGLPMAFTEILSLNNLSTRNYFLYIAIYIIFFMLDDILIFTISMLTLKSVAISTKFNKYSHLIGGLIMIIIGLLLILRPDWLAFNFK